MQKTGQNKTYWHTNNIKLEKYYQLKKIGNKNCTCYYFDDVIKFGDFDFNNILLDEKANENILIYDVSYKPFCVKPLHIIYIKVIDMVELNI